MAGIGSDLDEALCYQHFLTLWSRCLVSNRDGNTDFRPNPCFMRTALAEFRATPPSDFGPVLPSPLGDPDENFPRAGPAAHPPAHHIIPSPSAEGRRSGAARTPLDRHVSVVRAVFGRRSKPLGRLSHAPLALCSGAARAPLARAPLARLSRASRAMRRLPLAMCPFTERLTHNAPHLVDARPSHNSCLGLSGGGSGKSSRMSAVGVVHSRTDVRSIAFGPRLWQQRRPSGPRGDPQENPFSGPTPVDRTSGRSWTTPRIDILARAALGRWNGPRTATGTRYRIWRARLGFGRTFVLYASLSRGRSQPAALSAVECNMMSQCAELRRRAHALLNSHPDCQTAIARLRPHPAM